MCGLKSCLLDQRLECANSEMVNSSSQQVVHYAYKILRRFRYVMCAMCTICAELKHCVLSIECSDKMWFNYVQTQSNEQSVCN